MKTIYLMLLMMCPLVLADVALTCTPTTLVSNTRYYLASDLTCTGAISSVWTSTNPSSDIIIDCENHTLTVDSSISVSQFIYFNHVTDGVIKNCIFRNQDPVSNGIIRVLDGNNLKVYDNIFNLQNTGSSFAMTGFDIVNAVIANNTFNAGESTQYLKLSSFNGAELGKIYGNNFLGSQYVFLLNNIQVNIQITDSILKGNYYNGSGGYVCIDSNFDDICDSPYSQIFETITMSDSYPLQYPAPYCITDWSCIGYECLINDTQVCNSVVDLNDCMYPYDRDYSEFAPQACDFCTPDWTCSGYGTCNETDLQPCNAVTDQNTCGEAYGGDYSEFTPQACDFCTPDWSCGLFGACNESDILPCAAMQDNNTCGESFTGVLSDYDDACTYVAPEQESTTGANRGPYVFCTSEGECFESIAAYEKSTNPTFFAGGNLQTENPFTRFFTWLGQLIWEGEEWP